MLNYNICKHCRNQVSWWNEYDEERWKKGSIVCVQGNDATRKATTTHKNDSIPEDCLFKVEHLVQQKD